MIMRDYQGLSVWITGASSGIGRCTALEVARRGGNIAVSARNKEALRNLADEVAGIPGAGKCLVIPFDVTSYEANLAAAQTIKDKWDRLDIAFFNAGTCEYVNVKNFDSRLFERLINTNYLSMVYGIEAVLPLLRQSRRPQIAGMSSTVAYRGLPRAAAYAPTKAAIRNMLEGLRLDLLPEHISVSIVCPGFVRTPLTDRNDFPMPMRIKAEKAARIIANGIIRRETEIHFPKGFSWTFKLLSALPDGIYNKIFQRMVVAS